MSPFQPTPGTPRDDTHQSPPSELDHDMTEHGRNLGSTTGSEPGPSKAGLFKMAPALPPRPNGSPVSHDDFGSVSAQMHEPYFIDRSEMPNMNSDSKGRDDSVGLPAIQELRIAPLATDSSSGVELGRNEERSKARTGILDKGKQRAELVDSRGDVLYWRPYVSEELDMEDIMRLTAQELSEPYNIFTFRYFLEEWPHLTIMVYESATSPRAIATVIAKQETHRGKTNRGYIAMLSVDKPWRRRGIATKIVQIAIEEMSQRGADEIVLETEFDNESSLALYQSLGFIREKRLHRFYTNEKDAFRLILPLGTPNLDDESEEEADMARWLVGSGPDELLNPIAEGDEGGMGGGLIPRSDTPQPSSADWQNLYT